MNSMELKDKLRNVSDVKWFRYISQIKHDYLYNNYAFLFYY